MSVTKIDTENGLNQEEVLRTNTEGNPVQLVLEEMHVVEVQGLKLYFASEPPAVLLDILRAARVEKQTDANKDKVAHKYSWQAKWLGMPTIKFDKGRMAFFDRDVWNESTVPLDLQGTPVRTWKAD